MSDDLNKPGKVTDRVLRQRVDNIARESGRGPLTQIVTNTLRGINHRGFGNAIPVNNDHHGLTFFTRPRLNLSYDNLVNIRKFMPLLTSDEMSVHRYIRVMLDPVGATERGVTSPLVDNLSPFIPVLTNNLLSLSGWPDIVADTYTSKSGVYKEEWSMIDGVPTIWNGYDIQANFRNMVEDPITLLFNAWTTYALRVHEGACVPYPDAIVERKIDYNTRIYRLKLDPTRRFVKKIGACGAAFPTTVPIGNDMNFESDKPTSTAYDQININFRCMGADYLDPILLKEFNDVVILFNPSMDDSRRSGRYVKVPSEYLSLVNHEGYPRIDLYTQELEWWISSSRLTELKAGQNSTSTGNQAGPYYQSLNT